MPKKKISRERIERVARMYRTSRQAAEALGIAPASFNRLCREHGIATPNQRREAARKEEQQRTTQEKQTGLDDGVPLPRSVINARNNIP